MSTHAFLSATPDVRLVKAFTTPFRNAIATARTCYSSKGIVDDADVDLDKHGALARSIYEAGHHTTFQHAQFQFRLANVSRQFIWSFLHSHPFYNSEQVSQRYVAVQPGSYAIPPLEREALAVYTAAVDDLFARYRALTDLLLGPVEAEFYRLFPARRKHHDRYARALRRRAMEAARYVLPVSMFAYLYHTVSAVTLLRYWRMCGQHDTPLEQRIVVGAMIDALLAHDEGYRTVLEAPLEEASLPGDAQYTAFMQGLGEGVTGEFLRDFDDSLEGRTSRLVDWSIHAEASLAAAVREVLGMPRSVLDDDAAIALVLDPSHNTLLGESLVLTTHDKLSRAMYHVQYTFRRRISHSADSQDQRHRMTPASRPYLAAQLSDAPDYITPAIIASDEVALALYRESMDVAWNAFARLRARGTSNEFAMYVLPNAVSVRYTESADLLNLHHKHAMRLCYNAQEEIWNASRDEVLQVRDVHPRIGRHLLPPCGLRDLAGTRPVCPEGERYCGVKVWRMDVADYSRLL